jgi:hypothetical protein
MYVEASLTSDTLHQTPYVMKGGQGLARVFHVSDALHRCSDVVRNGQEFPHFSGWLWIKKLV